MLQSSLSHWSVSFQLRKHYYYQDYSLAPASATQKCSESSVYGCTNRWTRHQSWLCIALPNSRHAMPPEPICGYLRYNQSTFLQLKAFLEKQLSRNCRWQKEIPSNFSTYLFRLNHTERFSPIYFQWEAIERSLKTLWNGKRHRTDQLRTKREWLEVDKWDNGKIDKEAPQWFAENWQKKWSGGGIESLFFNCCG